MIAPIVELICTPSKCFGCSRVWILTQNQTRRLGALGLHRIGDQWYIILLCLKCKSLLRCAHFLFMYLMHAVEQNCPLYDTPGRTTRLQQQHQLSAEQNNHYHEAHFVLIHPSSQSTTSMPSGSLRVEE